MSAAITDEVAQLLESAAVAVWLATANAECVPQTTRVMGARVERERGIVWLYVPTEQSARALANVRDRSRIAVTFCRITDYRAVQVKGTVAASRPANGDERVVIERYRTGFAITSGQVRIPEELVMKLACWPSTAVAIAIDELYSQTPGPSAGARL